MGRDLSNQSKKLTEPVLPKPEVDLANTVGHYTLTETQLVDGKPIVRRHLVSRDVFRANLRRSRRVKH